MSKIKIVITGAGGGGANNIISTIKEKLITAVKKRF